MQCSALYFADLLVLCCFGEHCNLKQLSVGDWRMLYLGMLHLHSHSQYNPLLMQNSHCTIDVPQEDLL